MVFWYVVVDGQWFDEFGCEGVGGECGDCDPDGAHVFFWVIRGVWVGVVMNPISAVSEVVMIGMLGGANGISVSAISVLRMVVVSAVLLCVFLISSVR